MTGLLRSGSLTKGVSPDAFGLPPGTALRCEEPAAAIRDCVGAYFVFDSTTDRPAGQEWMLPTTAQIWVVLTDGIISVDMGRRHYPRVGPVLVYGPTSRAMRINANGGMSIGIELTALGWARLFRRSAAELRDQLVPLDTVLEPEISARLATMVAGCESELTVKAVLDDFFLRHLSTRHRDDGLIGQITRLLADVEVADCASACAKHGIDPRVAGRVARRYFGFPLKLLMMRARFLRALTPVVDSGRADIDPDGYHDVPHFLRDARRFLGMTPRQYAEQSSLYVAAVWRARRLVLGAPSPLV